MIVGNVDAAGRALIPLSFRREIDGPETKVMAWIDTGFTGELLIPGSLIERMGLPKSSSIEARLADGTVASYDTFSARVDWFGQRREVEVIETSGPHPLLGVHLMLDCRLEVNYRKLTVLIEQPV